jgi:hypothetical protein
MPKQMPKELPRKTRAVNLKREPYDVYIGRGSKWGNPFVIGPDGTREQVIERYRTYLLANHDLCADLYELEGKCLGCFCKPLRCHGDVIVEELARQKGTVWEGLMRNAESRRLFKIEAAKLDKEMNRKEVKRAPKKKTVATPKAGH